MPYPPHIRRVPEPPCACAVSLPASQLCVLGATGLGCSARGCGRNVRTRTVYSVAKEHWHPSLAGHVADVMRPVCGLVPCSCACACAFAVLRSTITSYPHLQVATSPLVRVNIVQGCWGGVCGWGVWVLHCVNARSHGSQSRVSTCMFIAEFDVPSEHCFPTPSYGQECDKLGGEWPAVRAWVTCDL